MNKVFQILSVAVIVLTAASCGGSLTPPEIAKEIFEAGKAGDAARAEKIIVKHLCKSQAAFVSNGGNVRDLLTSYSSLKHIIDGVQIAKYDVGELEVTSFLVTSVTYQAGSNTLEWTYFVKENGKWKIQLSKQ
jgi:hypothetical protein